MGLIDGNFRANLEGTGMGYDKEVAMIAEANKLDLFTSPYVFDEDQPKAMAKAGADQLVAHVGLTTSGSIGAAVALSLDEAIPLVMRIAAAGKKVRKDILVICHGGPSPAGGTRSYGRRHVVAPTGERIARRAGAKAAGRPEVGDPGWSESQPQIDDVAA